jgi:hypothetical protein
MEFPNEDAIMAIPGYSDYQRREYCKDVACPVQKSLDRAEAGTSDHDAIRGICMSNCIHTTYDFHHWLIQKGYLVVRPENQ